MGAGPDSDRRQPRSHQPGQHRHGQGGGRPDAGDRSPRVLRDPHRRGGCELRGHDHRVLLVCSAGEGPPGTAWSSRLGPGSPRPRASGGRIRPLVGVVPTARPSPLSRGRADPSRGCPRARAFRGIMGGVPFPERSSPARGRPCLGAEPRGRLARSRDDGGIGRLDARAVTRRALPAGGRVRARPCRGVPAALLWRQTAPLVAQAVTSGTIVMNAAAGFHRLPRLARLDRPVHLLRHRRPARSGLPPPGSRRWVSPVTCTSTALPRRRQLPGIVIHFSSPCSSAILGSQQDESPWPPPQARRAPRAGNRRSPPSGCSCRSAPGWPASCTTRWGTRST